MLPQGGIWQQLRQRALDTVPSGTFVPYKSPPNLDEWLRIGAFTVSSATPKRFVLDASSLDIGTALFSDASFHLDHALEHSLSMRHLLASGKWHSSAWSAVSMYYWAFFLVVALTRLLGKTVWFVSAHAVRALQRLSPAGSSFPGAGPYVLELGAQTTITQREIILRRASQTRLHNAIWGLWFEELRRLLKVATTTKSQDLEGRLYLPQVIAANALGNSWPSDLRNLLNYTPGIGYGTVRGITPAAVFGVISPDPPPALEHVVNRLEANAVALRFGVPIKDQVRPAVRVLIDICFILDVIVTVLVDEVTERRNLDRRWGNARERFFQDQVVAYSSKGWPCSDGARV